MVRRPAPSDQPPPPTRRAHGARPQQLLAGHLQVRWLPPPTPPPPLITRKKLPLRPHNRALRKPATQPRPTGGAFCFQAPPRASPGAPSARRAAHATLPGRAGCPHPAIGHPDAPEPRRRAADSAPYPPELPQRNLTPTPSERGSLLALLHRMEERAGERWCVITGLSRSPLPSPTHSLGRAVAGRGLVSLFSHRGLAQQGPTK